VAERDRYREGMALRTKVMGQHYAQGAASKGSPFDRELQEILTGYGYGVFWSRLALKLAERSMITIAVLAALNYPEQLRQHIRAALRNGSPASRS